MNNLLHDDAELYQKAVGQSQRAKELSMRIHEPAWMLIVYCWAIAIGMACFFMLNLNAFGVLALDDYAKITWIGLGTVIAQSMLTFITIMLFKLFLEQIYDPKVNVKNKNTVLLKWVRITEFIILFLLMILAGIIIYTIGLVGTSHILEQLNTNYGVNANQMANSTNGQSLFAHQPTEPAQQDILPIFTTTMWFVEHFMPIMYLVTELSVALVTLRLLRSLKMRRYVREYLKPKSNRASDLFRLKTKKEQALKEVEYYTDENLVLEQQACKAQILSEFSAGLNELKRVVNDYQSYRIDADDNIIEAGYIDDKGERQIEIVKDVLAIREESLEFLIEKIIKADDFIASYTNPSKKVIDIKGIS